MTVCSSFKKYPGVLVLILVCILLSGFEALAAPACVNQYNAAKQELTRLMQAAQSDYRAPWERLDRIFVDLYEKNPRWANRPAALLRAGEAMFELGTRTLAKRDLRAALERFERLEHECETSQLADDAIYKAARVRGDWLGDIAGARKNLQSLLERYPASDQAGAAKAYLQELNTSLQTDGEPASLLKASWEDKNGFTIITLDLSRPTGWTVLSSAKDSKRGTPDRMIIDLKNTAPASTVRPVMRTSGSQLRRLRVDLSRPGATRLILDFKTMKAFTVVGKNNFKQLVLTTSPNGKGLTGATPAGGSRQLRQPARGKMLVMLDPGHGGTDDGCTIGDNKERDIVLKLSKLLTPRLQAKGLEVITTRTDNTWISVETRSRMAARVDPDLVLSLHVNLASDAQQKGVECYVHVPGDTSGQELALRENTAGNITEPPVERTTPQQPAESKKKMSRPSKEKKKSEQDTQIEPIADPVTPEMQQLSRNAAQLLCTRLASAFPDTPCSVKTGNFDLFRQSGVPGIVLEAGYLSNPEEAERLANQGYLAAMADALAEGLASFLTSGSTVQSEPVEPISPVKKESTPLQKHP